MGTSGESVGTGGSEPSASQSEPEGESNAPDDDGDPTGSGGETENDTTDGTPPPPGELAPGISIADVLVNQAVDIELVRDGVLAAAAERVAPIVGGRPMLVRADYTLADDFTPREVVGRLWLQQEDGFNDVFEDTRDVSGPGSLSSLGGTFNWTVPPEAVQGSTVFRIELIELPDASPPGGDTSGSAVPADGFASLDAWGDPMVLDVMLVPFSCGGGELEISPEDLADFESYLFNTYPVQELNLEVHDVVASSSCSEFDAAEYDLPALRESEGADPWVYYGGLLPGDGGGYSISIEDSDQMDYRRTFANHTWRWYGLTFDLFAHELGHNHGRDHSFQDSAFPGDNSGNCGSRSTNGWGVVSGMMPNSGYSNDLELGISWVDPHEQLIPPTSAFCDGEPNANEGSHNDFMSYAYPYWISAYTYAALADRVRLISSWRDAAAPPPDSGSTHRIVVSPEGQITTVRRAGSIDVVEPAGFAMCGEERVSVRRGRSVQERFEPGRIAERFEYATYEFNAVGDTPCVLEIDGLRVAVE